MTGGGGGALPPTPSSGGQFLLQLLQKPNQNQTQSSPPPSTTTTLTPPPPLTVDPHHHHDPAVAALGPTLPFPPWPSNGHDPHPSWPNPTNSPYPSNFLLPMFPPNPWALPGLPPTPTSHFPGNHPIFADDLHRLGLLGHIGVTGNPGQQQQQPQLPQQQQHPQQHPQQQQPQQRQENMLMFGSLPCELRNHEGLPNGNSLDPRNRVVDGANVEPQFSVQKMREVVGVSGTLNNSEIRSNSSRNWELDRRVNSHGPQTPHQGNQHVRHEQGRGGGGVGWGRHHQNVAFQRSPLPETIRAPPGFPQKPKGPGQWGSVSGRREFESNVDKEGSQERLNHHAYSSYDQDDMIRRYSPEHGGTQGDAPSRFGLSGQLDHPGSPMGSNLHSVPVSDIEESLANLHGEVAKEGGRPGLARQENRNRDEGSGPAYGRGGGGEHDDLAEQFLGSLMRRDGFDNKNGVRQYGNSRDKDFRSDIQRGLRAPGQRMRNHRREMECRSDIDRLNAPFLAIYDSLIPAEEEKAKQKQLLSLLEKLVNKEWPRAQLFLYGSCANSFGVSKSDIDVCLAIEDADISKSEILLKLADILQSDNLENVQALTRARVPIVKLMDPVTGISCDICINNVLAVVNTKLLRDYAQIDGRLRQLAFIVKHWAKSRGVNETYQGTLSSYAYVLMCIHFLQQRKPAILPCLQGMEATYAVTVEDVECAFFDQVENLRDFGAQNKESIAQLVWAFFNYWAYRHDYTNTVISVRTGSIISKRAKDWTRRIGNDRHLICIEDPFEISHDLGRVVDKHSIKVLREEFERAANIMQYDPDPCVTLFEPYVPG